MGNESGETPHPEHDVEDLPPGLKLCGWRIIRRLARGEHAVVYLVENAGHHGALKMVRPRASTASPEDAEERIRREVLCGLQLTHPNVLRAWASEFHGDPVTRAPWVVMPFVEGDTLRVWSLRHAPTAREVLRLFVKLADALDAAHRLGIRHGNVTSGSVLVRLKTWEPVLIDFGMAHFTPATPSSARVVLQGPLTHRSPEALRFEREPQGNAQARYEYRPTDDLYALGVTLYEVLTATLPFSLPNSSVDVEPRPPAPPDEVNPHVPPLLSGLVMRLLARSPAERPASARALRDELVSLDSPEAAWDVPLRLSTLARPSPR